VAEPPGGGYVRASTTSGPRLPSSDLRDQLHATLSGSYTLERELGAFSATVQQDVHEDFKE
jgi:hypothetical protein